MLNLRKRNYFWIFLGINLIDTLVVIFYMISTICINKKILEMTYGLVLCVFVKCRSEKLNSMGVSRGVRGGTNEHSFKKQKNFFFGIFLELSLHWQ